MNNSTMNTEEAYRLDIKLDIDSDQPVDPAPLIPIFHRWIQNDHFQGDVLIDVADYRHVPDGPGVILVAYEAHLSVDFERGRPGLRYARKRPPVEKRDFGELLRHDFSRAQEAARLLQRESAFADGTRISDQRWTLKIQDRLRAPATDQAFEAVEPELRSFLSELYADDVQVQRGGDTREGLTLRIEA